MARPIRSRWQALCMAALAGTLPASCADPAPHDGRAAVVEVIDGDTVTVRIGSHTEDVRLLGVDTPETKHPNRPIECFGPEASAFTDQLLPPGTAVRLERDIEARDAFGRLLAYVHRVDDDLFVNLELVRQGYADVLVIAPNEAYAPALRAAATGARASGLGLWGRCEAIPSPP